MLSLTAAVEATDATSMLCEMHKQAGARTHKRRGEWADERSGGWRAKQPAAQFISEPLVHAQTRHTHTHTP